MKTETTQNGDKAMGQAENKPVSERPRNCVAMDRLWVNSDLMAAMYRTSYGLEISGPDHLPYYDGHYWMAIADVKIAQHRAVVVGAIGLIAPARHHISIDLL